MKHKGLSIHEHLKPSHPSPSWGKGRAGVAIPSMATIVASALLANLVAAYPVPCTWLATEWWTVEASTYSVFLPGTLTVWLWELSHSNPATCQVVPSRACEDCKCCCFLTMAYGIWLGRALGGLGFSGAAGCQLQPAGAPVHGLLSYPGLCSAYTSHNLLANVNPCSLWGLGNLEQLDLSHSLATVGGTLLPTLTLARWQPAVASWGCSPGHHARPGGPLAGNDSKPCRG